MVTRSDDIPASRVSRKRRVARKGWPRRLLAWFLAIAVALPVALVVLFRFLPVPATPLMIAEWGPERFGAEAAAQANFRKPAARLSGLEAARLAVILPNPRGYRADVPGPYVTRQSEIVAARIGEVVRDKLDACIYR